MAVQYRMTDFAGTLCVVLAAGSRRGVPQRETDGVIAQSLASPALHSRF